MLADLQDVHEALLRHISELEAVLAADPIQASLIARIRLHLSKASGRRRRIIDEAVRRVSEAATKGELQQLNILREQNAQIFAASSAHVGEWSIEAILSDVQGYRAASASMRKSMRERIERERTTLYPILERLDHYS